MKERPILFSGPMVRAILEGRKTQTRRILKQADFSRGLLAGGDWADAVYPARESGWIAWHGRSTPGPELEAFTKQTYAQGFLCPYGQPGDRLWVRETWMEFERTPTIVGYLPGGIGYRADLDECGQVPVTEDGLTVLRTPKDNWRPSIFMPREHSRITLEVVSVRVERVQEITHSDAIAEGIIDQELGAGDLIDGSYAVTNFAYLWDSINAKRGYAWESNPWVWVVSFVRAGREGDNAELS